MHTDSARVFFTSSLGLVGESELGSGNDSSSSSYSAGSGSLGGSTAVVASVYARSFSSATHSSFSIMIIMYINDSSSHHLSGHSRLGAV